MKIQLALAVLLASAVAHADEAPGSNSTRRGQADSEMSTQGTMIGNDNAKAGAESVATACELPAESFIDQLMALLAGTECEAHTTSGNMDTELPLIR